MNCALLLESGVPNPNDLLVHMTPMDDADAMDVEDGAEKSSDDNDDDIATLFNNNKGSEELGDSSAGFF